MKTSEKKPPNYDKIAKVFPVDGRPIVFTYGDTIYNVPKDYNIPKHLEIHESIHTKQQGNDPDSWWDKYLADPNFRLEQEVQAYACQYNFAKQVLPVKMYDQFLDSIAFDLSSDVYGKILSFNQAHTNIRRLSKNIENFSLPNGQ